MPSEDHVSDEYVANLLTKDAKDSTIKYSSVGLQALLPRRPTTNAPRANTRFLKNIIRETDSHNAALRAREAEEAKARLRCLRGDNRNPPSSKRHESDYRKRGEDFQVKRRRRNETDDVDARHRISRRRKERSLSSSRSEDDRKRIHRRCRRLETNTHRDVDVDERNGRHTHRHRHHRDRHNSDRLAEESDRGRDKSRKHRRPSRSLSRLRLSSQDRSKRHRHHLSRKRRSSCSESPFADQPRKPNRGTNGEAQATRADSKVVDNETKHLSPGVSDSDPLESIVGPAPPPKAPKVRARGRGVFSSSSAMDAHFASNYDPSMDAHPNSDSENDWDQALEALRDRQRWKKQGADRLRSAGFTEEEVSKWEKGGEKKEEDVRWRGRGEGREWDRGKVVEDDDGSGGRTPDFGRLKGT